jgi:signal recognition particle receptor subunit beta
VSFINHAAKEINCKIIYYGPGLSGKTTNVQCIYAQTQLEERGKLVTLSTENERTLFFDFLPLSIGEVSGFKTRFHLYTIPGQTFYEISRQFILKGIDGIVFVADSQSERMEANIESFESLEKALEKQGYDIHKIPLVFQYNM